MSDLGNDKTGFRKVYVKSYYLKELADLYDVSKFIMRKKLKPYRSQIGENNGYLYDEKQVALIFCLITLPSNVQLIRFKE